MSLRCPECGEDEAIKVTDSRPNADRSITRRRLMCDRCHHRFTTQERYFKPKAEPDSEAVRLDAIEALLSTALHQLAELRRARGH